MRVSVDRKLDRVTGPEIGLGAGVAAQDGALGGLLSPDEQDVKQVSEAGGWAMAGDGE
jgi:hypothetical protein